MSLADPKIATLPPPPTAQQGPWETQAGPCSKRAAPFVMAALAAVLCLLAVGLYALFAGWVHAGGDAYLENDSSFWAWARFLHEMPVPASIYDFPALNAFQHRICLGYQEVKPFAYPPSFLVLLWPLGLLAVKPAYLIFLAVNLAAYVLATWQPGWGRLSTGLAVIAPSTVIAMLRIQDSLLVAALLLAGCKLVPKRPILAGVLFGLVSFKPQFGLLVPVAIVSAREWRCFSVASATVIASVIVSGTAFGWNTWAAFPVAMVQLGNFASTVAFAAHSPTIAASLRLLGASPSVVRTGQMLAMLVAGMTVFWAFRRGFSRLATAALMAGGLLATPYAFPYDLPILFSAVFLVGVDALSGRVALRPWEIAVLAFITTLPYLLYFVPIKLPYSGISLLLFFGLIVRRMLLVDRLPAAATAFGF